MSLPKLTPLAATLAVALAACGGVDAGKPVPQPVNGVFLDGAVEGLTYKAGSATPATTGPKGEFTCLQGDTVSFSVGGINLGSATCATIISPLQLANASSPNDTAVVNRLLALQLLDDDSDPQNGIKISAAVSSALAAKTLDFGAAGATFNTALASALSAAGAKFAARSVDDERRMLVREHFEDTLATRMNAPVAESFTQGGTSVTVTRYQVQFANSYYVPYEGSNAKVKEEFPLGFLPSYGSALTFKGVNANGDLEFYGLTDRGPNGDGPSVPAIGASGTTGAKIFPAPSFAPQIGVITVSKAGAILTSSMPVKLSATIPASGLPLPIGQLGNSAEVPVLDSMKYDATSRANFSSAGLDTEAIAYDKKRNAFWVSDEYGPFLLKLDATSGVVQARYAPGSGLPAIFAKRRANRGMEGMAYDSVSDKVHGFLQSPLSDGNATLAATGKSERVERFAAFTRWVEFDPNTGATTRMFAYPINGAEYADGRTGNAKLGEMVALGNGKFIVIEQGAAPSGKVFNKLMLVDTAGATDINGAAFNPTTSDLEKSSMGAVAVNGADWSKVVALKKTVLLDLNAIGWLAEKAEGLALVDGNTLALANDNDFGLKTKIYTPSGEAVEGADVTACTVDANGTIVTSSALGCNAANSIRVARGDDKERPSRLWLIKFAKALNTF